MTKDCSVVLHRLDLKKFEGMKIIPLSLLTEETKQPKEGRRESSTSGVNVHTMTNQGDSTKKPLKKQCAKTDKHPKERKKQLAEKEENEKRMTRCVTRSITRSATEHKTSRDDHLTSRINVDKKNEDAVAKKPFTNVANGQPSKKRRIEEEKEERTGNILMATKKPKRTYHRKLAPSTLSLRPALQKFEMVWARIRGFPNWPGIIEEETPKGQFRIHFFGDYTRSDVGRNKIMHLLEGFNYYANLKQPTKLLYKAIVEAQMFVMEPNRAECPICKMMSIKQMRIANQFP